MSTAPHSYTGARDRTDVLVRDGRTVLARYAPPLARLLMSAIFLMSGIAKCVDFAGNVTMMESKGMPAPQLLLIGAIVFELLGGLSILLGFQARWGALALFLYLIPTTLLFHNFWHFTGDAYKMQQIHFMKNLAIMGGLLLMAALGPGSFSVDASERHEPRTVS